MQKNLSKLLFLVFIILTLGLLALAGWQFLPDKLYVSQAESQVLRISFLDVGQGDAALIKTPAGHNILIDGGPGTKILEPLSKELSWYDKTIDLMILTHPHSDHVDGLIPVLKRYEVKQILSTGVVHGSPTYLAWLDLVREQNIPLVIVDREQTIDLGDDCQLQLIYPVTNLSGREVTNLNNSSIVARLTYQDTSFLFMGDAEIEVEQELIQGEVKLKSNVLKTGHHGSDTSSSEEFLNLVKPEYAIISSGVDNDFGHPSRRVLKRLERLGVQTLRTDELGTIRISSDGKNIIINDK